MEEKMLKAIKKQTMWMRIMGLCSAGLFLIFLVAALILVPQVTSVLNHMADTLESADAAVSELDKTAKQLAEVDFEGLVNDTQGLINQSSAGIDSAMGKLDQIDIEGLNQAISDLSSVVSPLARLFGN